MSFDLPIQEILQYGYNMFASLSPVLYLYIGGAFALFILGYIIRIATDRGK